MRTRLGWALCVLGVLVTVAGAVIMVYLGPDSRISSGPHRVETDGVAVVTAPKVIRWADVRVDVLAEVPVRKPIFLGLGNSVDVEDLVGRTARIEVTDFRTPWKPTTREVEGRRGLPGAPTALDWWIEKSAGLGGAGISTTLPDESVSLAILSVGSSNLSGLEVTVAYGVKGGFAKGLALVLLGAAVSWSGWLLRRRDTGADDEPDDEHLDLEEDVVYVYVDDDGVEHELSPAEAESYDVVDEEVEVVVVEETAPVPDTSDDEQVVYVYVDDDGVEHEVSADELAEFEIVDEEDKP